MQIKLVCAQEKNPQIPDPKWQLCSLWALPIPLPNLTFIIKTIVISELLKRKRTSRSTNPLLLKIPLEHSLAAFLGMGLSIWTTEVRMTFDGKGKRKCVRFSRAQSCRATILSILLVLSKNNNSDENLFSESIAKQFFHLQKNFVTYRTATFQVKKSISCFHKHVYCKAVSLAVAEISWLHLQPQTNISEAKKTVRASFLLRFFPMTHLLAEGIDNSMSKSCQGVFLSKFMNIKANIEI